MQEVITIHEKFLKVYLPVAPGGMLTHGESKFAFKYSNDKAVPSGFSHFYYHRVVLSTQKNFKVFSILACGSVKSYRYKYRQRPPVQPQRPAQKPDH